MLFKIPLWLVQAKRLPGMEIEGEIKAETGKGVLISGHAIAKPTTHCLRCGRLLTHPISVHIGYGPVCSANLGIYYPDHLEPHEIEMLRRRIELIRVETWLPKSAIQIAQEKEQYSSQRLIQNKTATIPYAALDYMYQRFVLRCHYDDRDLAKQIPGYRWDKAIKAWIYPADLATVDAIYQAFPIVETTDSAARQIQRLVELASDKLDVLTQDIDIQLPVKIPLYRHQKHAAKLALEHPSFALLMEQGTGKTAVAIAVMAKRYIDGQINRVLIVCPKSVAANWEREILRFARCPVHIRVLAGRMSVEEKKYILETPWPDDALSIAIVNYESLWRESILPSFLAFAYQQMVILDESQRIKDPRANQSKAAHMLQAKYKLILTGTPINRRPFDFFSQYLFLDPDIFGHNFYRFTRRYGVWRQVPLRNGRSFWKLENYQNLDELVNKAHAIAFRIKRSECLDLPPVTHTVIQVELETEALNIYNQILNHDGKEVKVIWQGNLYRITTPIAASQGLRLSQVTGGFLHSDDGQSTQVSTAKVDALVDLLEDLLEDDERKVVIFARFIDELFAIHRACQARRWQSDVVYGKTKNGPEIIRRFQENHNPRILIIQYRVGGVGLNLQRADTAIFYSKNYSRIDYEQAAARIQRIGQTHHVQYFHLVATGTIDEDIEQVLKSGEDIAKRTVDDWKEALSKLRIPVLHHGSREGGM